jgi:hypothetical protein
MIEQCSALDGYLEIIRINKISSEEKVTIPNGKEIKLEEKYDVHLSFGQVSQFEVETKEIIYDFVGYTSEPLNKDATITMIVNLIIDGKLVEEEAVCTALKNIAPKEGEQLKAEFNCKVENVDKANECTGLEIVSSEDITSIPNNPKLINPVIVDELIEKGKLKNKTSETTVIPVFNATIIDTKDSRRKGIFTIIGEFLSEFTLETRFEFEIILITGERALSTLPNITGKGEVEIKCELQEELKDSKIMIEQFSVLDGLNELIRINKICSEDKVTVSNGKEIKLIEIYDIDLSF